MLFKNAEGDGQATSTLPNSVEGIPAAAGSGESSNIDPKKTRILKQYVQQSYVNKMIFLIICQLQTDSIYSSGI